MKCKTKDCNNQTCIVLGIETLYCCPCFDIKENAIHRGYCPDCGTEPARVDHDNGIYFLYCPKCNTGEDGGQDPFSPTLHD